MAPYANPLVRERTHKHIRKAVTNITDKEILLDTASRYASNWFTASVAW